MTARSRLVAMCVIISLTALAAVPGCGDDAAAPGPVAGDAATADGDQVDEAERARQREVAASRARAGEVGWELAWGEAWDVAVERRARERFDTFRLDTAGTLSWTFLVALLLGTLAGGGLAWRRLSSGALEDSLAVLADGRAIDRHLRSAMDVLPRVDSPADALSPEQARLTKAFAEWLEENRANRAAAARSPTRADRIAAAMESQRALADEVRVEIARTGERGEDVLARAHDWAKRMEGRPRAPEVEAEGPPRRFARPAGLTGLAIMALGLVFAAAWAAAGLVPAVLPLTALGVGITSLLVAQSEVRRHGGSGILPRRIEAPAAWLLRVSVAIFCVVLISASASPESGMDLGQAPVAPIGERPDPPPAPGLVIPGGP